MHDCREFSTASKSIVIYPTKRVFRTTDACVLSFFRLTHTDASIQAYVYFLSNEENRERERNSSTSRSPRILLYYTSFLPIFLRQAYRRGSLRRTCSPFEPVLVTSIRTSDLNLHARTTYRFIQQSRAICGRSRSNVDFLFRRRRDIGIA
jgi:hypothetical protein